MKSKKTFFKKFSKEELLKKTERPAKLSLKYHKFYHGKVQVMPKCPVRSLQDFSIWYTPGVAAPCREIKKNPEDVYEYTSKWNYVAVISDGTRVLGLGDIGPLAGLPVMEGKALLFKYLGGVDAFPLVLNTKDPDEIIHVLEIIEPTFGGINLEDISKPKCFYILEKAREILSIPVWHDDSQGTASVVYAGLINALKIVGKRLDEIQVAMIGAGAANITIYRILKLAGLPPKNIIMVDSKGILHPNRRDLEEKKDKNPYKWQVCLESNGLNRIGGIPEALKDADVCIAASKPGPNTIKKEWISHMNDDAIVFAMANPIPEIWPWDAVEAGARIVGTGRSDFPNQINNSLGFPGIFRGVLDVRAKTITDKMCIAAGNALAKHAEERGLNEEYIIPSMSEWEVYPKVAVAAALQSIREGVARIKLSREELMEKAVEIIENSRKSVETLFKNGLIPPPPNNQTY